MSIYTSPNSGSSQPERNSSSLTPLQIEQMEAREERIARRRLRLYRNPKTEEEMTASELLGYYLDQQEGQQ